MILFGKITRMSTIPTRKQVSAGGVAFRRQAEQTLVALISVGEQSRWQLPKGTVGENEQNETAALREVREEAGISTEMVQLVDKITYWFYTGKPGKRIRIHKEVYFYLLKYRSGDPADHDHEVNEARWVEINQAIEMLTFESEREVLRKAKALLKNEMR